jgi:hypothetical protein
MLRYLPPQQFTRIDSEPFREGGNGAVYGAIWSQPVATLCTMRSTERELAVVIKRIRPKEQSDETASIVKFLHEVLLFSLYHSYCAWLILDNVS